MKTKFYYVYCLIFFITQSAYANEGGKIMGNAFEGLMIMAAIFVGIIILSIFLARPKKRD